MSVAAFPIADSTMAQARPNETSANTPPKRRTTALADTKIVPEPR